MRENNSVKKTKSLITLEELFRKLKILSPLNMILLCIMTLFMGLVIIWSIKGTLPIKISGSGIVLSEKRLYQVTTKEDGVIVSFHSKTLDRVHKGELLVVVENADLKVKIESLKIRLNNAIDEYEQLKSEIAIEGGSLKKNLNRELETNLFFMQQTKKEIESHEREFALRKKLYDKGLISYALAQQIEAPLIQLEIDMESLKERHASLSAELEKGYRSNELSAKKWEIQNLEKEVAIATAQKESQNIYSPIDGIIISTFDNSGKIIHQGDPLLLIEPSLEKSEDRVIYGYFPIESGKDIKRGTPVEVSFDHILEYEYGLLLGVVESVSDYAISSDQIIHTLYNKEIANKLIKLSSAVMEVTITPLMNPKSPKEYLWSTGVVPPIPVTTGSFCSIEAIVSEVHPIYFIFPFASLKKTPIIEGFNKDE